MEGNFEKIHGVQGWLGDSPHAPTMRNPGFGGIVPRLSTSSIVDGILLRILQKTIQNINTNSSNKNKTKTCKYQACFVSFCSHSDFSDLETWMLRVFFESIQNYQGKLISYESPFKIINYALHLNWITSILRVIWS